VSSAEGQLYSPCCVFAALNGSLRFRFCEYKCFRTAETFDKLTDSPIADRSYRLTRHVRCFHRTRTRVVQSPTATINSHQLDSFAPRRHHRSHHHLAVSSSSSRWTTRSGHVHPDLNQKFISGIFCSHPFCLSSSFPFPVPSFLFPSLYPPTT